jgi:trigger factor
MNMKVTVEDRSSVKKVLHIEIAEADVTRALDEAYGRLKRPPRSRASGQAKRRAGCSNGYIERM